MKRSQKNQIIQATRLQQERETESAQQRFLANSIVPQMDTYLQNLALLAVSARVVAEVSAQQARISQEWERIAQERTRLSQEQKRLAAERDSLTRQGGLLKEPSAGRKTETAAQKKETDARPEISASATVLKSVKKRKKNPDAGNESNELIPLLGELVSMFVERSNAKAVDMAKEALAKRAQTGKK